MNDGSASGIPHPASSRRVWSRQFSGPRKAVPHRDPPTAVEHRTRAAPRALVEACGVRLPVPRADIVDPWHGILLVTPTTRPAHLDTRGVNGFG
ncbi:hypothetical protein ACQEVC_10440 [Plantactinospora sp. CA-294935]|uniref:hypothetical protein n=1 Tax=Plantactinospora sp. CA-294935 TaxID=3240012 RepID=UPI003D913C10